MNQSSMEWLSILAIVLILSVAFLVANQRDELKKQAVERGFAEWVCDPSGNTTWQWIAAASLCAGDFIPQGRNRIKATPFIFLQDEKIK